MTSKVPPLQATYVETLLQSSEPGMVVLRTSVLLAELGTEDAWGVLAPVETVIPIPPWPGASDDEGDDDEC